MPSQPSEPNVVPSLVVPHEDWEQTPASVRALVSRQQEIIAQLVKRVEELEAKLGQNSQNSSRPPWSDTPQQRVTRKKIQGKG
jgi:transposase